MRLKVLLLFSQFDENKSRPMTWEGIWAPVSIYHAEEWGGGSEDFGVITIKFTIRLCNILINLLAVNWQSTLPVNFASYPFMLWWLRLTPRCLPWEQWRPSKSSHCNISVYIVIYIVTITKSHFLLTYLACENACSYIILYRKYTRTSSTLLWNLMSLNLTSLCYKCQFLINI